MLYFVFFLLSILFLIKLLTFKITTKKRKLKKPPSILESVLTVTGLELRIFLKRLFDEKDFFQFKPTSGLNIPLRDAEYDLREIR